MKLRISAKSAVFDLVLRDTPTPVSAKLAPDARQIVEPGTACFWTEGDALALPFGRTPISTDERPKLASRCNVVGSIGNARDLAKIRAGDMVSVTTA